MAKPEKIGYIKIFRSLKNHWIWSDPQKLKWWLDILLSANYTDQKVLLKGTLIECKKGQSIRSLDTWAKDWRTTKKTVQTFFKLLQKDEMLVVESMKITTRITICNYASYNVLVNDSDHTEYTQPTTDGIHSLPPSNKDNKDNKVKKGKEYATLLLPFEGVEFSTAWAEWIEYKKSQHKFSFKALKFEQISVNALFVESHKSEAEAIAMLRYAIGRGWKGWVPKDDVNFYSGHKTKQPELQANGLTEEQNRKIFGE